MTELPGLAVSILSLITVFFLGRIITESRQAEKTIKESEQFFSNIFNSIQDGISIHDKDFNILSVNSSMEKWYAHLMPLTGKKCYEAYHGRKEPCEVCPASRTLDTGNPDHGVVPLIGKEGIRDGLSFSHFRC